MDVLISNNAHAATSQKVKDILCTVSNPALVNLTINTKTMLNAVLGTSRMSKIMYSPSQVPPIIFGYHDLCM